MRQHEAVVKAMEQNGGYATLGYLYHAVLQIPGPNWGTKTPPASIRRIVQKRAEFFKIKPGLWGLESHKDILPEELRPAKTQSRRQKQFTHSYYQGLILQIGRIQNFDTYVPPQDRNQNFLPDTPLAKMVTSQNLYKFGYDRMLRHAKTIDVLWFNDRKMPAALFEVEHTTDMRNSMLKFNELRDFRTEMYIVAAQARRAKFQDVKEYDTFKKIRPFVRFLSYEKLSDDHSRLYAKKLDHDTLPGVYAPLEA